MNTYSAYSVSMDELVFANKNKSYGAYLLRKNYQKRISIALLISVFLFTLGTSMPLILKHLDGNTGIKPVKPRSVTISTIPLAPINPGKDVQDVIKNLPPVNDMVKYIVPRVMPDDLVPFETYIPDTQELEKADPGLTTVKGVPGGLDPNLIDYYPEPIAEEKVLERKPEETVFVTAEEMPMYPGGEEALLEFISSKLRYPEIAIKAGVEGRVAVEMIVEKTGEISGLRVIKSIGAGCDEEALRVCRLMARWSPGKQNGVNVRVKMVIPFVFRLN